jgi:8-oxo-dGTP diphosphatase
MITCILENNNKTSFRHITVGSLVVNKNKEILLVKRSLRIVRGGKYTIPGGFLDRDEDIRCGALRELKEETGLDGKIKSLFQINDNPNRPKEDRQNVDFIFMVEVVGGRETLNSEVSEIRWFGKNDLPKEDDFAFDHRAAVLHFLKYLENPFTLPIMGKI